MRQDMKREDVVRQLRELQAAFEHVPFGNWSDAGHGLIVAGLFGDDIGVTPGWSREARELMLGAVNLIRNGGSALLALAEAVEDAPECVVGDECQLWGGPENLDDWIGRRVRLVAAPDGE